MVIKGETWQEREIWSLGLKGQGKVGHVEACLGMPGHAGTCPGREPQTSPGGGPTTKPSNQEPTRSPWTPITAEPAFSSLYGSPSPAIKHFPTLSDSTDSPADSLYPADSLCFADPPRSLAYPPPGVLPESDRPIKGPDQRSIGVALSSRSASYT